MYPILCRGFVCLTFLLASALCLAEEPLAFNVPRAGVPTPDSSLDQFIARAQHQAETGSTELKQLVAQLDPLKAKQQVLLSTRRAKEAELARLQSTGGDAKQIATLQQEIAVCRSQLNTVDMQFQVLISRIQPGPKPLPAGLVPAPGGPVPVPGKIPAFGGPVPVATPVPASSGPVAVAVPGFVAGPTPGLLTHAVPPDKIKAAADALARSSAPSAAAARTAATQILSASRPGFTSVEVEQLAHLIVEQASRTNAAELQAELNAGKQANEKRSGAAAPDQASQEIKFEIRVPPSGDAQSRLQELQARQAKLEQATIELMKKSSAVPAMGLPVK